MADKKISDLTAITGANTADDDLLVIVDTSAGETKRITLGELENGLARSNFALGDNEKITFGASDDLQIYHDGSNSFINDTGTGNLVLRGANVAIQDASANNQVFINNGGSVDLRHAGSAKLATTSTGIDVTGTVTADGLDLGATTDSATLSRTASDYQLQLGSADSTTGDIGQNISFGSLGNTTAAINTIDAGASSNTHLAFYTGSNASLTERMQISNNGDISFYEDTGTTAKFFWDASLERLGLGTTSLTRTLHVNSGTTDIAARFESSDASVGIEFADSNTVNEPEIKVTTDDLAIRTGGTERMRIDSSGNVGIGTSSPATALDVNGTVTADGLTVEGIAKVSEANARFRLMESDTTDLNTQLQTTAGVFKISTLNDAETAATQRLTIGNSTGNISFYEDTGTTAKFVWDASVEGLTIGGTANTDAPLVVGKAAAADTLQMRIGTNDTTASGYAHYMRFQGRNSSNTAYYADIGFDPEVRNLFISNPHGSQDDFVIDSSGNVGIGTSSPSVNLHVTSSTSSVEQRIEANNGVYSRLYGDIYGTLVISADGGNTGASSSLRMAVDGSEAMRINSSGNVGIGTSSPEEILDLSDTFPQNLKLGLRGYLGQTNSTSGTLLGHSVKAKTVSPTGEELVVTETNSGGGAPSAIYMSSGNIEFHTAGAGTAGATFDSERMRIDSSGNLLVGKTSTGVTTEGFEVRPDGIIAANRDGANPAYFGRLTTDGDIVKFYKDGTAVGSISVTGSATAYNTSSDYRLKTDVQPMTGATERLKALKPVNFEWISSGERVDGFLAHEAQEVVPEAVTGTKDAMKTEEYEVTPAVLDDDGNVVTEAVMGTREVPDYQGIDQSKIVPLLVASLQEALTEIESLKDRIAALEN